MTTDAVTGDILTSLKDDRARIRAAHEGGMAGLAVARELSASMDAALVPLWERVVGAERGLALVALGGYGRGELSPASDVDLMVLHDGHRHADDLSKPLFYALWDAGLTVGHATRTPKQCVKLAAENLEAETSFLQPRLVAGDESVYAVFAERTLAASRKRRERFIADVRQMMRSRHERSGTATSQLEPNLKEGSGGLRDLHVLGWFAALDGGIDAMIGPTGAARLDRAAEILTRVRNHLHYLTELPTELLLFQFQRATALFLGYDDSTRPAEDAFMRALFAATRDVEHLVSSVVAELGASGSVRAAARAGGETCFAIEEGRVVLVREPDLALEPERALELFCSGAPPGAAALRWLEGALASVRALPWTDAVRRAFMASLRTGDPRVLEAVDVSGVLGALIPAWDAVRCQPQHNVYHRFTVDAHLFNAVARVAAIAHDDEEPLAREVWRDLGDPDGVLLAALLHDVGKGAEEDHSVRGERLALEILDHMRIAEPRRSTIAWLVRHHLLLVDTASRRDLNDENLIVDIATRIGDAERARMLYMVTVADGRATGPTAWSPWRSALVAELFTKVIHVLERGELVTPDAVELVRLRTAELRRGLSRYPAELVDRHLEGMSRAYILAFPTTVLIRQFALMADDLAEGDVRTHVAATEETGIYEFTVVARDKPGLFSKVSGVLALNGVSILAAQGFTRADGTAVEVFRCVGAMERSVDAARWERVSEDIRRALRGRLSLPVRLDEKRRAYGTREPKRKRRAPKVIVANDASDFLTVVEVHASDRIGLLFDITSAFAELALDIQVAKIATYAEDVVDVFYVRDLDGQKITDREHLAEIERTLLHRLGGG